MHELRRTSFSGLMRSMFAMVLILAFLLSACGGAAPATTAPGETSADEPLEQSGEQTGTDKVTSTLPAALPFLQGTLAPTPAGDFSPVQGSSIVEMARWGKGVIYDATLSPNGKTLAIATATGLYLHDSNTMDQLARLDLNGEAVYRVQFSPDGMWLAAGSQFNEVWLYSLNDKKWGSKLGTRNEYVVDDGSKYFAFSPDAKSLAVMEDGKISLYKLPDFSLLQTIPTTGARASIQYTEDGQRMVLVGMDYYATIDLNQEAELFHEELQAIRGHTVSSDGALLVIGHGEWEQPDETLVIDTTSGNVMRRFGHSVFQLKTSMANYVPISFAISPNSETLAVAYTGSALCLWSLVNGRPIQCLENDIQSTDANILLRLSDNAMVFSRDGKELVSFGPTSMTRWDTATWQMIDRRIFGEVTRALVPEQGETFIAVGASDWETGKTGQVMLCNREIKQRLEVQAANTIRDVRYTWDGKQILTASEGGVEIWDAQDGSLVKTLEGDAVRLDISMDGMTLAVALADNSVQLYALPEGTPTFKLDGHSQVINMLEFSDNQTLVSVSGSEVLVWNTSDGSQKAAFTGADEVLAFWSGGGGGVVTLAKNLKLSVWNLDFTDSAPGSLLGTDPGMMGMVAQPLAADISNSSYVAILGKNSLNYIEISSLLGITKKWSLPITPSESALIRYNLGGDLLGVNTLEGLQVFEAISGDRLNTIQGEINAFDFNPQENGVIATAQDNFAQIWSLYYEKAFIDYGSAQYAPKLSYIFDASLAMITPDLQGKGDAFLLSMVAPRSALRVFNPQDGSLMATWANDGDLMSVSPGGRYFTVTGENQDWTPVIYVRDFLFEPADEQTQTNENGIVVINPDNSDFGEWGSISISDNGRVAYAHGHGENLIAELADGVKGEALASFPLSDYFPLNRMAALSADGNRMVMLMENPEQKYDPFLTCLDVSDPQHPTELWKINWTNLGDNINSIGCMAFNPNGDKLVLGDYGGHIFLIDALAGKVLAEMGGHTERVESLVFSPDGEKLYTASRDGTIRVWGVSDIPEFQPTALPTAMPYSTPSK